MKTAHEEDNTQAIDEDHDDKFNEHHDNGVDNGNNSIVDEEHNGGGDNLVGHDNEGDDSVGHNNEEGEDKVSLGYCEPNSSDDNDKTKEENYAEGSDLTEIGLSSDVSKIVEVVPAPGSRRKGKGVQRGRH